MLHGQNISKKIEKQDHQKDILNFVSIFQFELFCTTTINKSEISSVQAVE